MFMIFIYFLRLNLCEASNLATKQLFSLEWKGAFDEDVELIKGRINLLSLLWMYFGNRIFDEWPFQ